MNGYMWRIQWHKERKYNPQGGSIPPTSLPRVASYRRQPRAIESITPVGLSTPLAIVLPGAAVGFVLRLYALWAKIQSKKNGL